MTTEDKIRKCKYCGWEGREVWITNNICDICNKWLFDLTIRISKKGLEEAGLLESLGEKQ